MDMSQHSSLDLSFDLVLYDIDGTLVDTGGAGMFAIMTAAERYFGAPSPSLDLAGSTDLGIVKNLLDHYGHAADLIDVEEFFGIYHPLLEQSLRSEQYTGKILPCVEQCLQFDQQRGSAIGLLTGNTAQGAAIKMRHFGLDHHFGFGAYGDDHADRNRLGPVAQSRATHHTGLEYSATRTLVIGDTPKDIACAHAMGARCLAVATGHFTADQLRDHGADFVVNDLSEWLEMIS
jgi:phosphoglycolate phosphatase-like HAD superfamily hydrolase